MNTDNNTTTNNTFINFSNHNSSKWTPKQLKAAEVHGNVVDIQFPHISPEMTSNEVKELALTKVNEISALNPSVVHVMGEMTFTHVFVKYMQKLGITCVASTTNRIVEETEDGRKLVTFDFIQFREYQ